MRDFTTNPTNDPKNDSCRSRDSWNPSYAAWAGTSGHVTDRFSPRAQATASAFAASIDRSIVSRYCSNARLPISGGTRMIGPATRVIVLNGFGTAVRSQLRARQAREKPTPNGTTRMPVREARYAN